jgi:tungstate transport system substrate-binding protein
MHPMGSAVAALLAVLVSVCAAAPAADAERPARRAIILATTTSTQDSGLLDVLMPRFTRETGIDVKVIAVGSGAALAMARRGDADAVLAHAPDAERALVADGELVDGRLVMHNDFVLVGPPDDPAGVRKAGDRLRDAMAALARHGGFVSRGDRSGTHEKELALWAIAGVDPATVPRREETGQGMGATLHVADQRRAYTLADRGTYLAVRRDLDLAIVFAGDPRLLNVYHAYRVSPARHPGVHADEAGAFLDFLVSRPVQEAIGEFRRAELGEPLFVPDAGRDPASPGLR